MTSYFLPGQRLLVTQPIQSGDQPVVPPGRYVIVKMVQDWKGTLHYRVRSLPDEDIESVVEASVLAAAVRSE